MNISKKVKTLLCIALVLILLGSALGGLFNTGLGATKVTRIRFDGGRLAKVEMLPIELHWKKDWSVNGLPRAADAEATGVIFEALKRTSAEFGTKLALRDDGIIEVAGL